MSTLQQLLDSNSSKSSKEEKTQSQINKCLNEKRRREQENVYIEELAELISANVADMSSFYVKPDKCAILQETVNQIRQIKQEETGQPEAVQQSQVSSSKPSILANDVLGPLLLEALDGFLFVVNSQTKVDFVSENVNQYLKYSQEDLVGKSIYNIIHVGDHTQFSTSLRPVSLAVGGACIWPADSAANKSRTFNCRMLIKPPGDEDDLELKQTQVVQYENMQITAVLQPYPSDKDADSTSSESQSCLVCIARRLGFVEKTNSMLGVEQFTTKEDLSGKIVACDTSGIQPSTYNYPDFVGQNIQEFVHINDVQLLSKHHHEVLKNGTSTSGVYRFKLQENRYVFVQTKSKLFNNPSSNKPEFIMSTHSIIRECDSDIELKGSASTSLMKSIIGQGGKPRDQDLSSLMQTFHSQNINKELMTRGLMTGMETLSSLGSMSPGVMGLDSNQFDINPLVQGDMAPNLDDVLDLLANPSSWDSNKNVRGPVIGSSTTTFTAPGPSLPVNAPVNTPTTRVSWSNVNLGMIQQPHTTQTRTTPQAIPSSMAQPFPGQPRRPMHPNFQGRNMMNMEKGPMSPSFIAQRSPGFSGQKSPGYNMNIRSPSPMMNQRSPASTSGAAAFPQPRTPSMMSPSPVPQLGSPALSNAGWQQSTGRASQKSPLQALQSMEAQAGGPEQRTVTMNLPYMGMMPPTSLQEKMKHMDKSQLIKELAMTASVENQQLEHRNQLRQLLTRDLEQENKKPSPEALPQTSSAHQVKERPSPQPSSTFLDQPQSTCLDGLQEQNGEDGSQKDGNQEHTLLKQLLSQEEETEVPKLAKQDMSLEAVLTSTDSGDDLQNPNKNEAEAKSGGSPMKEPQEANVGERKAEDGNDKNEAEPKKMDNYLLKALLNNESAEAAGSDSKEQKKNQTALLQKLLQDDEEQTREAKPKDPNTMDVDQVDTSSAQEVNRMGSHEMAREMVNTSIANMRPADSGLSRLLQIAPVNAIPGVDKEKLLQGNNLENFLSDMWDKQTEENERGIKRKAEGQDPSVHSTDVLVESNNPSDQGPSQMAKKNVLLARLLSKTATKEAVINTQHTVNPSSTPQTSLPKNLADKIIDVLPTRPQDIGASAMETIQAPNAWDNPRTDPNSPFPGNTSKDTTGLNMAGNNTVPGLPRSTSDTPGAGGLDVQLQQLLNQPINPATPSQGARNTPPTSLGGNTNNGGSSDPFLSQILQQATDLQQDCTNNSASPLKFDQPMTDDSNLLQQLEQALKTSNISLAELDSFLGINSAGSPQFNTLDMNEQMAIDAIQQQLMSVEPQTPASVSTPMPTSVGTPTVSSPMSIPASQAGNGATSPFLQAQAQAQAQAQNSMSELRHQLQQQTNCFNQTNLIGFNQQQQQQQQQGPRFQQPQGLQGMGASLNQMDFAGGQTTTAMHVRQSLLLKQKQKQMREQQQTRLRLQQQQERRLLLQHQRQQQFNQQQQQQQQFMQGNMGLDGLPGPSLPENFSELMNTSMAPNVSLQRNQSIPGPMSPRFVGAGMQQQGLGQMIRNPNRASPFTSQGQPGWNQRPSMLQGMQQNPQFSSVQRTPGVPQEGSRFRFTDSQFTGGQQLGMIGGQTQQPQPQPQQQQQQQQVFNQNRMVQRAPMPQIQGGMQSPRGQRSPYGNQEALQMSPHAQKLSPNAQATPTPQQLTPPYPQMPMSSGNLSVSPGNLPVSPMNSQPGFPASMASFDPPSSMYTNSLSQERKAQLGAGGTMTTATSTTSQYVKQEIRAICNARSQSQQMSTSSVDSGLSLGFDGGEIPMDVLESLDQLTRQQLSNQGPSQLAGQGMATPQPGGGPQQAEPTGSDMPFQDDLLNQTREEAKRRYEKFQALSSTDADDPELRASNLFRNQLITSPSAKSDGNGPRPKKPGGPKMDLPSVSVVQPEPRAQLEEVKPADQKNSLLQQLLSEN